MNKIALFVFIRPFYQKTLGFWSLVLIFGGVLMEVKQHILLGRFFFKSPIAFWVLPLSVVLFGWIHLRILVKLLKKKDYLVFHQVGLFSNREFAAFWTPILLTNFGPLFLYFLFLSFFAWEQNSLFLGCTLWLILGCILGINYLALQKTLKQPLKEEVILRPPLRRPFPRFTWPMLSLRQHRPILLLLTKGLSLLVLNGFFIAFQSGRYDHRWLQFAVLCISYFQLPLILEKTAKELEQQSWTLALPLSLGQKLGYQLGSLSLLVVPELLFLGFKSGWATHFIDHSFLGILLLSLVVGIQLLIYLRKESTTFPTLLSVMFFGLFLVILFGLPDWVLGILFVVALMVQEKRAFHF